MEKKIKSLKKIYVNIHSYERQLFLLVLWQWVDSVCYMVMVLIDFIGTNK